MRWMLQFAIIRHSLDRDLDLQNPCDTNDQPTCSGQSDPPGRIAGLLFRNLS